MAETRYKPESIATVLTTELNSLASGSRKLSGAISNDGATELNFWDDVELVVTFGTAPSVGEVVSLYLIPAADNSNFADGSDSVDPPATSFVGSFPLRAVTSAQRLVVRGVQLPPTEFKYLIKNETSQAFASSGNTLKRVPYRTQST